MVMSGWRGGAPADPVKQVGVGTFQQRLVAIELNTVETGEMGVGKAAEDEIALARPPMPGTEQKALAADICW